MSDLDEPPAKVLKIDNIGGVTHVTELSEYPAPFDGTDEGVLCSESGIIEGGADPPEEQEQWLSEGILTDDDYMPASQETAGDRTDSQLGSTHEEEHLDTTLDSEGLAEAQQDMAENQQILEQNEQHLDQSEENLEQNDQDAVSNGHNLDENELKTTENQHDLINKQHLEENEQNFLTNEDQNENGAGIEEHLVGNEHNLTQNEQCLAENQQNLDQNDQSLAENEQKLDENEHYENEEHLADTSLESETAVAESGHNQMEVDTTTSLNESQEDTHNTSLNDTESQQREQPETIEKLMEMSNLDLNMESQTYTQYAEDDSNIVIQRVITLNKEQGKFENGNKNVEINIEEAVKNFDGEADVKSDDFDSLLKRNTETKKESKIKPETKDDDGNDTDDLLRMLGEDDNKTKKKLTKTVKDIRNSARAAESTDDEDDDFVYESTRIKKIKAAQSVLKKKMATKAVPEVTDDDAEPMQTSRPLKNFNLKSGASILRQNQNRPANVHVIERPARTEKPRQYTNKRVGQSLLKPTSTASNAGPATTAPSSLNTQGRTPFKPTQSKTSTPFKPSFAPKTVDRNSYGPVKKAVPEKDKVEPKEEKSKTKYAQPTIKAESGMIKIEPGTMKVLPEEIIDEEEFLDEEEFGVDEDEFAESDNEISHRQRIMKPEMMDEEVPSDGESGDEDPSLYDEMPTSDSDDADDWFQLDLRCEKAGDYLPLLGPRAKELLLEEKRRVSARLSTLSQSHAALAASGRQQAAALRRATAALAEIDDMIRAA